MQRPDPMKLRLSFTARVLLMGFFLGFLVGRNVPGGMAELGLSSVFDFSNTIGFQGSSSVDKSIASLLPALKWPQKNYTVRMAIENGVRIDHPQYDEEQEELDEWSIQDDTIYYHFNSTRCEAPRKGLATVVTALYDMPSKHSGDDYRGWFDLLLSATDPMIVFLDPNSTWPEFVMQRRQHAPTIIAFLPFKDLTMGSVFSDTFWYKEVFPLDAQPRYRKGVDVYKIWNEKMIMMHEAALLNPFDTELFFWTDAGYFRKPGEPFAPQCRPLVRNNITANGIRRHQIIYSNPYPEPEKYEIAAGSWGGTLEAIQITYEHYFKTFWYMILNKIPCAGYEQHVQTIMCKSFPDICRIVFSNGDWFLLGRFLLRSKIHSFVNQTLPVLLGIANETLVQLPVTFQMML